VSALISLPFLSKQIAKDAPDLKYGINPISTGTTQATYAVTDSITEVFQLVVASTF
jgi:multiple sugar transport system substrate-binding protein